MDHPFTSGDPMTDLLTIFAGISFLVFIEWLDRTMKREPPRSFVPHFARTRDDRFAIVFGPLKGQSQDYSDEEHMQAIALLYSLVDCRRITADQARAVQADIETFVAGPLADRRYA